MDTEDLRLAIYRSFAETGRAPRLASETRKALQQLHYERHIVLDGDEIVMAHPFSAIPLGFSVMGERTLWWGGCAWDSFALPHLLPDDGEVLVATRCPNCGAALAWAVNTEAPPAGGEVAHFLTPVARMWDDVVHTCGNQRLFCSTACVDGWLEREGLPRGYTMDLSVLWNLAAHWYDGRLDRGYVRREPVDALAYFTEVGLTGPFWGLAE
ncbi:organomercurial lyase [Nonomuraea sp. NPDC050783]|uniref:organomercurial lyase n=1 Tax=Nonomuraea sp. NPDC050783 TaxID=3154634 RepID=UPI0034658C0C